MASASHWSLTILKVIGLLFGAGFLLFIAACLFWWWAWTNTGEMNRQRFKDQVDTTYVRHPAPGQRDVGTAVDTLGGPAR